MRLSEPVAPRFLPEAVSRLPLSAPFRQSQKRTLESRAWMLWMRLGIIGWKPSAYGNSLPVQACRSRMVVRLLERIDEFPCAQSSRSGSEEPPLAIFFLLAACDRVTRHQIVLLHDCVRIWKEKQGAKWCGEQAGVLGLGATAESALPLSRCSAGLLPQHYKPLLILAPFPGE
jgi:hypothetical protein